MPASAAVAPSGPYMVFIDVRGADGTRVASVGASVTAPGGAPCEPWPRAH